MKNFPTIHQHINNVFPRPGECHIYQTSQALGFFVILLQALVCHEPAIKQYRQLSKSLPFTSKRKANLAQQNSHIRFQNILFKIVLEQYPVKLKHHEIELASAVLIWLWPKRPILTSKNQFFRGLCLSLHQYQPHRSLPMSEIWLHFNRKKA